MGDLNVRVGHHVDFARVSRKRAVPNFDSVRPSGTESSLNRRTHAAPLPSTRISPHGFDRELDRSRFSAPEQRVSS
jgi:hypothetical protein